jgi:prevent-host-death family protein
MTTEISQRELRNDSGAILRAVEAGEDFVVTRNGTPLAELRPLQRRRTVARAELIRAAAQLAPIDAAQFRADLDSVINQDFDA